MTKIYADEFSEISEAVSNNEKLKRLILSLIASEPMPGKVLEGGARLETFRDILNKFFSGEISVSNAIPEIEFRLPREESAYCDKNQVFPHGWAERQLRTQISRFYNQAVLQEIISRGEKKCIIEHSSAEAHSSTCSIQLAGKEQNAEELQKRLLDSYRDGKWSKEVKIPNHPHCTHTVKPISA